ASVGEGRLGSRIALAGGWAFRSGGNRDLRRSYRKPGDALGAPPVGATQVASPPYPAVLHALGLVFQSGAERHAVGRDPFTACCRETPACADARDWRRTPLPVATR